MRRRARPNGCGARVEPFHGRRSAGLCVGLDFELMTTNRVLPAGGLALALSACAAQEPDVKYAAGYVPGRHAVALLGVFRDGRLDETAWDELEPKLSEPLG